MESHRQENQDKLIKTNMTGVVVRYSIEKSFGFIKADDKSIKSDIFVYFNQIIPLDNSENSKYVKLCQNQKVEFDLYLTKRGLVAKNVIQGEILEELFFNKA